MSQTDCSFSTSNHPASLVLFLAFTGGLVWGFFWGVGRWKTNLSYISETSAVSVSEVQDVPVNVSVSDTIYFNLVIFFPLY